MRNIIFIAMLMITGCSSLYDDKSADALGISALVSSTPCCTDFSELTYNSLAPNQEVSFFISKDNDSFIFDSGKSFVAGFDLSSIFVVDKVVIESPIRNSVFFPFIQVLDEDYRPIVTSNKDNLTRYKSRLLSEERFLLILSLADEQKEKAKYLLVFTTKESIATKTKRQTSSSLAAETGQTMTVQNELMQPYIPHSATGEMSIKVSGVGLLANEKATEPTVEMKVNEKDGFLNSLDEYRDNLSTDDLNNYGEEIVDAVSKGEIEKALALTNKAENKQLATAVFINAIKLKQ